MKVEKGSFRDDVRWIPSSLFLRLIKSGCWLQVLVGDGCLFPVSSEGWNLETQHLNCAGTSRIFLLFALSQFYCYMSLLTWPTRWLDQVARKRDYIRCVRFIILREKTHIGKCLCIFVKAENVFVYLPAHLWLLSLSLRSKWPTHVAVLLLHNISSR